MAFLDLTAEIAGTLPGVSPLIAEKWVNRALAKIYSERPWSFLQTDGAIICPAMVTTGAVAITQYADTVTLDTDASAALLPQTVTGSIPGIQQLQIRFGAGVSIGGIYSILDFDASTPTAIVLTLDRVVQEVTNATSAYQCYRAYITPTISDFLKFESIVDFANAITLTRTGITLSSAWFDIRDPQRTSQGLAYYMGGWGGNRTSNAVTGATTPNATLDAGTPIYELWPHPTQGQTFYCRFWRKGQPLINPADVQAFGISDELILARVYGWHAYPFAQANVGNFPTFGGGQNYRSSANWPTLIGVAQAQYKELLKDAKRNDDAQMLQSVWNRGHGLRGAGPSGTLMPVDSAYIQAHLLNF